MKTQSFDTTMFRTEQENNCEQKDDQNSKLSFWEKLWAVIDSLFLPVATKQDGQDNEDYSLPQPEIDRYNYYALRARSGWYGSGYWFGF